jgi:hypothetical protein
VAKIATVKCGAKSQPIQARGENGVATAKSIVNLGNRVIKIKNMSPWTSQKFIFILL